jgi:hypothetical protein
MSLMRKVLLKQTTELSLILVARIRLLVGIHYRSTSRWEGQNAKEKPQAVCAANIVNQFQWRSREVSKNFKIFNSN